LTFIDKLDKKAEKVKLEKQAKEKVERDEEMREIAYRRKCW